MALPHIEITGNLVQDPELRFTSSGLEVATIRIGTSDRRQDDSGQWVEKDKLYINATAWRNQARMITENLVKGDSVIVIGKLKQQEYTDQNGVSKVSYQIEINSIAKVIKPYKQSGDSNASWNPAPASGSTDNTIWGQSF